MVNLRQIGTSGVQIKGAGISDFCSALAAIVGPTQNMFFLTVHYFNSFIPLAQQAGQAAVLGRLSLSLCLWYRQS